MYILTHVSLHVCTGKLFDAIAHGVDAREASMKQRAAALQAALHLAQALLPSPQFLSASIFSE